MCYDTSFDFNRIAQKNHLDKLFWDNQTLFSGNLSYMYMYVQSLYKPTMHAQRIWYTLGVGFLGTM